MPETEDPFAPRKFEDRFARFSDTPAKSPTTPGNSETQNPYQVSEIHRTLDSTGRDRSNRPGLLRLLFSIQGRINRQQFWLIQLGGLAGMIVFSFVAAAVGRLLIFFVNDFTGGAIGPTGEYTGIFIVVPIVLTYVWINLASTIKRYHDRGKPGSWILLSLVPYVGSFAVLVECGFLPGTPGRNQYGPNPDDA